MRPRLLAILILVALAIAVLIAWPRPVVSTKWEHSGVDAGAHGHEARDPKAIAIRRVDHEAGSSSVDGTPTPETAEQAARVRGTVVDAAGAGVADARVSAFVPGALSEGHDGRSGPDGSFEIADLRPGPWRIGASDALGHVGVAGVNLVAGDNGGIVVRFVAGGEISGTVLFEGRPVAGATVELDRCHASDPVLAEAIADRDAAWEHLGRSPFSDGRGFRREAATNAEGRFVFRDVESATCSLDAEKLEIGRSLRRPGVRPGDGGIVMMLERGGDLRGRILDAEGKAFEPEGMVVANGRRGGENVFQAFAEIEHGRYEFRGLPPGSYRLSAPLFHRAGPPPAELVLAAGEKRTFDLKVPWSSTVRGRVVDSADGTPLEASIDLITIRLAHEEITWYTPLAVTDADGRFEIANVSDAMTIEIHSEGHAAISMGIGVADHATLDLHDVRLSPNP